MPSNDYFAAIQVSTQIEFERLMRAFDWNPITIEKDSQQYYECFLEIEGHSPLRLIAAVADEMGNVASSVLCLKLCEIFHPAFMILTGIAAGVRFLHKQKQPELGDVLIADRVWNFSNGKYVDAEESSLSMGNIGFLPRPNVLKIKSDLRRFIKEIAKSSGKNYQIHIGAMASGSAVVSNREIVANYILPIVEKTKGLDMESYGVMYTEQHIVTSEANTLIVKGICDFADKGKCDDFQEQAADNAYDFLKYFFREVALSYKTLQTR